MLLFAEMGSAEMRLLVKNTSFIYGVPYVQLVRHFQEYRLYTSWRAKCARKQDFDMRPDDVRQIPDAGQLTSPRPYSTSYNWG